ncbi:hypothetical protein TWF281_009035 [Arthrobotrys megalospora]
MAEVQMSSKRRILPPLETPGPAEEPGDAHSSQLSIGSQSIVLLPNNCNSTSSVFCFSSINLKSSFITSIRISADFFSSSRTPTGSLRILSVPKTTLSSLGNWYGYTDDDFARLYPLFDVGTEVKTQHNYDKKTDKTLAVMKNNVNSGAGVTCLAWYPLAGKGPEGLIGCETVVKDLNWTVPGDCQIVVLLTGFVWAAVLGEVRIHAYVNVW